MNRLTVLAGRPVTIACADSDFIARTISDQGKRPLLFPHRPRLIPVWLAPLVVTTLAVWVFADWRWMVLCLASMPFMALMLAAWEGK